MDADTVAGGCRRVKRSERDIIKSNYVSLSEDSTCNFREKAVITAVARGDVDGALTLVTLYGHDVNERDGIGWTPAINLCNDKDPALLQVCLCSPSPASVRLKLTDLYILADAGWIRAD